MISTVEFKTILKRAAFVPRITADAKQAVIEELLDLLVAEGRIKDREAALKAILERETTMSTGMQDGVALPHAKSEALEHLVTAIGLKPDGLDFKSLDGAPSTIFVLVLSPVTRPQEHMDYLAAMGRALSCPAVRDKLLAAGTQAEMVSALADA